MTKPVPAPWQRLMDLPATKMRTHILEMCAQAEEAVTRPTYPGQYSSDWRLAIAARIAKINAQSNISDYFASSIQDHGTAILANPDQAGRDPVESLVLTFMDKVAREPRAVVDTDVASLKAAGVSDGDIVRLCELNAFLSFQCRVFAGLTLLAGDGE